MFDSLPPKTAFSRFRPVHRTDHEGLLRVEGGSPYAVRATLRKGGKRAFPRVEQAGKRRRPSRIAEPCPANADLTARPERIMVSWSAASFRIVQWTLARLPWRLTWRILGAGAASVSGASAGAPNGKPMFPIAGAP
jgi:hypothetical protein